MQLPKVLFVRVEGQDKDECLVSYESLYDATSSDEFEPVGVYELKEIKKSRLVAEVK